jgi:hypothetical protein
MDTFTRTSRPTRAKIRRELGGRPNPSDPDDYPETRGRLAPSPAEGALVFLALYPVIALVLIPESPTSLASRSLAFY